MSTKVKNLTVKSLSTVMIVVFVVMALSSSVFAASKPRTFKVRQSQMNSSAGPIVGEVVIDPVEKTITFTKDTRFYSQHLDLIVTFDAGTVYNYTIKTMKDGKEIKLVWERDIALPRTSEIMAKYPKMKRLTGKIHISGSNSFANITKIDSFKISGEKVGFYFRQD